MQLRNASSYPTWQVANLITNTIDSPLLPKIGFHVKNCRRSYQGEAHRSAKKAARWWPEEVAAAQLLYYISISIGPPDSFPCTNEIRRYRFRPISSPSSLPQDVDVMSQAWWQKNASSLPDKSVGYIYGKEDPNQIFRYSISAYAYGGRNAPIMQMDDWREALVTTVAHEFEHIRQFSRRLPTSEVLCEQAAHQALTKFRAQVADGHFQWKSQLEKPHYASTAAWIRDLAETTELTRAEIAKETGCPYQQVKATLDRLEKQKRAEKCRK